VAICPAMAIQMRHFKREQILTAIHNPPRFHVGVAANLNADPLEPEILKIERKVKAGAEFILTQTVFDIARVYCY